jgi:PAS domain S-box-containing protein
VTCSPVLWIVFILGALVFFPSVYLALREELYSVAVGDTLAMIGVMVLLFAKGVGYRTRALGFCVILYLLGAMLLVFVGPVSQIYLLGFSVMTTTLLGLRAGVVTLAVNAVTLLAFGYAGLASAGFVPPGWIGDATGWGVLALNFLLVNAALVLMVGAVLRTLESGLQLAAEQAALVEKAQDAIVVRDLEGRLRFINPKAEALYGWDRDSVLGKDVRSLNFASDPEGYARATAATLRDGTWIGELSQVTRGNQTVLVYAGMTVDSKPGPYVLVRVEDTGAGMSKEGSGPLALRRARGCDRGRPHRYVHAGHGRARDHHGAEKPGPARDDRRLEWPRRRRQGDERTGRRREHLHPQALHGRGAAPDAQARDRASPRQLGALIHGSAGRHPFPRGRDRCRLRRVRRALHARHRARQARGHHGPTELSTHPSPGECHRRWPGTLPVRSGRKAKRCCPEVTAKPPKTAKRENRRRGGSGGRSGRLAGQAHPRRSGSRRWLAGGRAPRVIPLRRSTNREFFRYLGSRGGDEKIRASRPRRSLSPKQRGLTPI